jgi:uncharacterized iron-regulated protein
MYYTPMKIRTFRLRGPCKRTILVLAAVTATLILANTVPSFATPYSDRILRLSNRTTYGLGQILHDLRHAPVIFVGEKHDDANHHEIQLRVIRTLKNLDIPLTIGLEMFTARDQEFLELWVAGKMTEKEFEGIFKTNWGETWYLYREIFLYAREKRIPMAGLNIPEEITTQVARDGFSSLSSDQLSQLPGIRCDVSDTYRDYIRFAMRVHGSRIDEDRFENFCEAQLIWDTTMAYRTVRYLMDHPERTMVIIAGNSHAWKPGIPRQLADFNQELSYRVILPEIPLAQPRERVTKELADYLWLLEVNGSR